MSRYIGSPIFEKPTLTAVLGLDRFGKPLAELTSRPFCDVEMNPTQMRELARLLTRMADTTDGFRPVESGGRCTITLTTEGGAQ
jgi:hypothetical protein